MGSRQGRQALDLHLRKGMEMKAFFQKLFMAVAVSTAAKLTFIGLEAVIERIVKEHKK